MKMFLVLIVNKNLKLIKKMLRLLVTLFKVWCPLLSWKTALSEMNGYGWGQNCALFRRDSISLRTIACFIPVQRYDFFVNWQTFSHKKKPWARCQQRAHSHHFTVVMKKCLGNPRDYMLFSLSTLSNQRTITTLLVRVVPSL